MLLYCECTLYFSQQACFLGKGRLCGILLEDVAPPLGSGRGREGLCGREGRGPGGQRSCAVEWLQVLRTIRN